MPSEIARALLPQVRADGRHRRGVHRRAATSCRRRRSCARRRAARSVPISTHDQILGGPSGQIYLGCTLPGARGLPAARSRTPGIAIGEVLAAHGVGQPLRRRLPGLAPRRRRAVERCTALEINLRVLGTTHPFLALQFLTGGQLDPEIGPVPLARAAAPSTTGRPTTCAPTRYRGLLPEDLIDIVTDNGLHYSHRTESGVLFHLIGALSEFGKLGLTVDRQQPRRGRRPLSTHARRARSRSRPGPRARRHRETRMKIGLMVGREHSFPHAFIDRVNEIGQPHGITRRVREAGRDEVRRAAGLPGHRRPHLARGRVLPRLPQVRRAERHLRDQQPVLVDGRRQVLQLRADVAARRRHPEDRAAAAEGLPARRRHPAGVAAQPRLPDRLGRAAATTSACRRS